MLQYAAEPEILIEQLRKDEAANHPKSARCCLQCARHGGNSDYGRSSDRLALNRRHICYCPAIRNLLAPTLRRTSALVTEWSQNCGHLDNRIYPMVPIRLGHESLDVTLAYLKGKDAESEEAQEHANSSSLALYA
jgi:integrase